MTKRYGRSVAVLLCLLVFSAVASAEPLVDFLTKIHDFYVNTAVVVSILLLMAVALMGYFSEHRRWGIWLGGMVMVFLYNAAGTFLNSWVPPAT